MSHPITWAPAAGQRHASLVPASARAYAAGQEVETLCGRTVSAEVGEYAWLWSTCPECDRAAREMVGAPSLSDIARRLSR